MSVASRESEQVDEKTYCYIHPTVETSLRCNKCGQYICPKCAVRTPVGYRCTRCVHQQQDIFFTASTRDYLMAAVAAFVIAIPVTYILGQVLFLAIILGIPAGGIISEVVLRLTGRRRGRYTAYVIAAAVVVGALVAYNQTIAQVLEIGTPALQLLLYPAIAAGLCAVTAAARFRYGK